MKKRTGVKTALDAVIKRIDAECPAVVDAEEDKLKIALLRQNTQLLLQYEKLRKESDALEKKMEVIVDKLADVGLEPTFDSEGSYAVTNRARQELIKKYNEIKKKLRAQRDQIIIRNPLADEAEQAFMLRYFYEEVAKFFPSLKAVVSKMTK